MRLAVSMTLLQSSSITLTPPKKSESVHHLPKAFDVEIELELGSIISQNLN
jgi:hypothetical protein